MDMLNDTYALSLCAYSLNLAKHPFETSAFNYLESKAMTQPDLKWWGKPVPVDDKNPHYALPRSVNVEMTSYALLTYLRRNLLSDTIPVMKWLIKQRNPEGGFASTQVSYFLKRYYFYQIYVRYLYGFVHGLKFTMLKLENIMLHIYI